MNRTASRITLLLAILMCATRIVSAQTTTGTPPFGSLAGGPDVINLANLNDHLSIPILNKGGRGLPFNFYLTYDSSVWQPLGTSGSQTWTPVGNFGWDGSELRIGRVTGAISRVTSGFCGTLPNRGSQHTDYYTWTYTDGFGTAHPFPGTSSVTVNTCTGNTTSPLTATANDGSGYILSVNGTTFTSLFGADGNSINPAAGTIKDRNGNEITTSGGVLTDTLGTTALTITGSGTAASPTAYAYTAPNGSPATVQVNYVNYTVATNFGISGISEYKSPAAVPLVSSIALPDGTGYTFTYEATPSLPAIGACTPYAGTTCTTARIASVKLPTGGTISYTYTGGSNGIFPDGTIAGFKRFTPDTGAAFWNYSRAQETGAATITTVTDPTPQANQTIVQFQGIYETQRDVYSGSAPTISAFPIPESTLQTPSLLREIQICYNANTSNCTSTAITGPITQRNIIKHLSGASSWANSKTAQSIYKYNASGGLIEQDDYDYGTGVPGSLLKKTAIAFASLTNITAFRQIVTITDGSGTVISQTNYNYGDTVTATSGTPQHTSPSGSRGNLLSVNYYTHGSTFLTKSYTYYDTGNVFVATEVNGEAKTYTYGACGNSFPTAASVPYNSLSNSMTWNCTGGVQTSVTDENGQTVTTTYNDPYFWRPNAMTDQLLNQTTENYVVSGGVEGATITDLYFNSNNSLVNTGREFDGLGRLIQESHIHGPGSSSFDQTTQSYDSKGRLSQSSVPCVTPGSACPVNTTTYDALDRTLQTVDGSGIGTISNVYSQNDAVVTRGPAPTGENAKVHQSEYDALGRLTSVCEITSAPGSGTCGQSNANTGFWTKYTYDPLGRLTGVTQNAQSTPIQSRTYAYDLMGRMTSETQAESGTTSYVYDTDTTCGTYSGDLVKKTDAVGNVTCFGYDPLQRVSVTSYPSGSYASRTPNRYFVYDTATVNGAAMSNGKKRMVEAYTATTPTGTKITDIGFSYTVRGEPSDVYEATPNSGGYYHVNEQFWANGVSKQLSGLPGLPTLTFSPDGEGRVLQVLASSGQNPVTSTAYNAANLPTSITFGSADSDSFTYDPNTDRMTQYQFSINGQSLTGVLTWNANSTLQKLNITDALNSADTQSCSYAYDDLVRLQSANCGSVWSQTFSYDAFGNISKSGSMSFQPTYSPSTNRITSVGGFTPSYDLNGNTLTDPAHTYTWDSAGKPVAIDTANMTFDALGRMVEQNRSGAFTQFVYGPHGGKFAIMNGQSLQKAFVPLPGGAQAVYNASGLLYYGHSDHLGSIRLGSTPSRTISFDVAYAPFGETYASSGSVDPAFTGQRQDTVSGLYDFPAREYSNEGRWSTPDPSGIGAFNLTDPQSINRYVYVRNTPLTLVDLTGLDCIDATPTDAGQCKGYELLGTGGSGSIFGGGDAGGAGAGGTWTQDGTDPSAFAGGIIDDGGLPVGSVAGSDASNTPLQQPSVFTVLGSNDSPADLTQIDANGQAGYLVGGDIALNIDNNNSIAGNTTSYADSQLQAIAPGVVSGAGVIGDPMYVGGFLATSAVAGAAFSGAALWELGSSAYLDFSANLGTWQMVSDGGYGEAADMINNFMPGAPSLAGNGSGALIGIGAYYLYDNYLNPNP